MVDISIDALIAWLEKQPPQEKYSFIACDKCAITQWVKSMGGDLDEKGHSFMYKFGDERKDLRHFSSIVNDDPMTFGRALYRARKFKEGTL